MGNVHHGVIEHFKRFRNETVTMNNLVSNIRLQILLLKTRVKRDQGWSTIVGRYACTLKIFWKLGVLLLVICTFISFESIAQSTDTTAQPADTLSKFERFSQKGEELFKVLPAPIYSYSTEAGQIVGLVKFNLFDLSKTDTVSQPSRISGGITVSTEGFVNMFVSTIFNWDEDNNILFADLAYKKQPQYIFGVGNDVSFEDPAQITLANFLFNSQYLKRIAGQLYVGPAISVTDYTEIGFDTLDFPNYASVPGHQPNTNTGLGVTMIFDNRDNRYNATSGYFGRMGLLHYPEFIGNDYVFSSFGVDLRTYFNPWKKHVIALQATSTITWGEVPFYSLAMLGGTDKMRGYYEGSLRDNVLFDSQVEYRLPIWKMFGMATWIGTGRVAHSVSDLSFDGFWLSYGFGLRLRVDTENNANVRFDWGFGNNGTNGFYINFAEAF